MVTIKEMIEERDRLVVWLKGIANRYDLKWTYTLDDYDYPIFRLIFPNKIGDYFYKIQINFYTSSFNTTYYKAIKEFNCGHPISQKSWKFVEYPKKRFAALKDSQVLFEDWVMDIIKNLLKESQIVFTKEMIFGIFNEEYSKIGGTCTIISKRHTIIGDNRVNEYVVINGKSCGPKICVISEYDNGNCFLFSGIGEVTGYWRYTVKLTDTEDYIRRKIFRAVNSICIGLRNCHNSLFESGATTYLRPEELRYIDHDADILYKVMCAIKKENKNNMDIKKVIFNEPATIVLWEDGTKTVVKRQKGERWDKEKGLAMAIVKKTYGNKGNYNDIFKKWCEED